MLIKKAMLKFYFLLRLPFIITLVAIFGRRRVGSQIEPHKILIIRLDRLGDLVLTVPVIDNLKLNYPKATIAILVRPYIQGLGRLIRSVDEVIVYEDFFSTARQLREREFDIAIDMLFDYALKPAILTILSGAPRRIGFPGGFRERLFTDVVVPGRSDCSMADINLEIIKLLNIPMKVKTPRIILEKIEKEGKPIVAIHPGGHYASQRWNPDRFAALARKILGIYDINIVIAGGPGEELLAEVIMERLKDCSAEPVFTDMEGLVFLLARSCLLICNNSGPLHLAAALGIPTVSTMGPTDPYLWWPQGDNNIVIRKGISCSPCSRGQCKGHECLESITVDEVFDKVRGVLDGIGGIKRR